MSEMNFLILHAADLLTLFRLVSSVPLLFLPVGSPGFTGLYLLCGVTDMLDGPVARKTGTASDTGALLDSIADLCFLAVCLIRILGTVILRKWITFCICAIGLLRLSNPVCALARGKRPIFLHTKANRITGLLLFLFPLSLPYLDPNVTAAGLCAAAVFASVQERILLLRHDR